MTPVSSREVALMLTLRARDDLVRAARAIPADRRDWRPHPLANSAVRIVAHCAAANLFYASVIGAGPLPYRTEEERAEAIDACDTLERAEALLNRGVTALCDALVGYPEVRLSEQMTMPWGERVAAPLGLLLGSSHMQYHEGQLNYIQTLLGDDEQH